MLYEVLMVSNGGVKETLAVFDDKATAYRVCEDLGWTWMDENSFEWSLEIAVNRA